MSLRRRRHWIAAAVIAPLLAGCASGLDSTTSREHASVQGGQAGFPSAPVGVHNVYIAPYAGAAGAGSSALPAPTSTLADTTSGFVVAVVVNDTSGPLRLTNVVASSGGTASPQPAGADLSVPAGGTLTLADPLVGMKGTRMVLTGTSGRLITGHVYTVTFSFSDGTNLTVHAPVWVNPFSTSPTSAVPNPTPRSS